MKKRFLPIATAISAAFLLAACSQTDVVDDLSSVKPNTDNNAVSFSTYTAKNSGMRAGTEGNMTTSTLRVPGFGVFAYYTPGIKYEDARKYTSTVHGDRADVGTPNFMYNQQVSGTGESDWTYFPLKYWPNDFSNTSVDKETDAAYGSGNNGNVSFFAYAPYVAVTNESAGEGQTGNVATVTEDDNPNGIIAMTSNTQFGDPKITYQLGSKVDLLWGTLAENYDHNVVGENNAGTVGTGAASPLTYADEIVAGKRVATDLNKQAVKGQVKFNFIHALAGIAGSTETVDPDYDEEDIPLKSGFKVTLDLDNSAAGEIPDNPKGTGGHREKFKVVGNKAVALDGTEGEDVAQYYRTIVTIRKVTITNNLDDQGDKASNSVTVNGQTYDEQLFNQAVLNLATGQWSATNGTEKGDKGETIVDHTVGGDEHNVTIELNPDIAEYAIPANTEGTDARTSYFDKTNVLDNFKVEENLVNGVVEEILKNVYKEGDVPPILLIPGQTPNFRITVEYVVRQYDDALATKYTEVVNKISKIVTFPTIKMNTRYSLIMRLGLTSVKFYAEVSKWEKNGSDTTTGPSEGPDGNEDEDAGAKVIELPANVVESTSNSTTPEP